MTTNPLPVENLETPCIVADMAQVRKNIETMQQKANQYHCVLRPHIKTHKSVEIARLQIEAGASGITCAKISEAEVMADGGIMDIFIAYPLVGGQRAQRAAALRKRLKRLILGVDSMPCAQALSEAAVNHQVDFEIRLEIDTGAKRTGLSIAEAVDLGKALSKLPGLKLTGVYTFKSLLYHQQSTLDVAAAAGEEAELIHGVYTALRAAGVPITDISAGSTPTGLACAETGLVNEIRPGTYVFYDQMTFMAGACSYGDIAAHIYATVVSTPSPAYAVLDGGTKVFPADVSLNAAPFYFHSYAYVEGRDDLRLNRLSEEHGMISAVSGETGLAVGQTLCLTPAHICTSVNLQNHIWLWDNGVLRKSWVDARGCVV